MKSLKWNRSKSYGHDITSKLPLPQLCSGSFAGDASDASDVCSDAKIGFRYVGLNPFVSETGTDPDKKSSLAFRLRSASIGM